MSELTPRCGRIMSNGNACGRVLKHTGRCEVKRKQNQHAWAAARRAQWYSFLAAYKTERGCVTCGFQSGRGGYFDLDHTDRSAGRNTAITIWCRRLNPEREDHMQRVLNELARCQVLCVACHREKTSADLAGDWEWPRD